MKKFFKITAALLAVMIVTVTAFSIFGHSGENYSFSYGGYYNEIAAMES